MPVPESQYSGGSEVQSHPRLSSEFEGHKLKTSPYVKTKNSPFHSLLFPAEINGLVSVGLGMSVLIVIIFKITFTDGVHEWSKDIYRTVLWVSVLFFHHVGPGD